MEGGGWEPNPSAPPAAQPPPRFLCRWYFLALVLKQRRLLP